MGVTAKSQIGCNGIINIFDEESFNAAYAIFNVVNAVNDVFTARRSGRRTLLISLTISFSMASWLELSPDLFSCLSFFNGAIA
jgi:hypothetical protein